MGIKKVVIQVCHNGITRTNKFFINEEHISILMSRLNMLGKRTKSYCTYSVWTIKDYTIKIRGL